MTASAGIWLKAMRLRTLPLAAASIIAGSCIAAQHGAHRTGVTVLALLTAFLFQVLSNFANDYGDSVHGADSPDRIGPERAVQSGAISSQGMKSAMILTGILGFVSAVALSVFSLRDAGWIVVGGFVVLGLLCILAAVTYTAGNRPYGYSGLGDLSVFVFFGLAGVLGTWFLHSNIWRSEVVLIAAAIGMLCTGVLNINNMRDHDSDKAAGKRTLVVRFGLKRAGVYHVMLISSAFVLTGVYSWLEGPAENVLWRYAHLAVCPFMVGDALMIGTSVPPTELDPYLKKLAIGTFLYSIIFGISLLF